MEPDERGEIVRCPWCGAWAYEGEIERPSDYCHHETLTEPGAVAPT